MKKVFLRKFIFFIATFALLINSFALPLTVLAQESPSPAPVATVEPIQEPTPTDTATPQETSIPSPTNTTTPEPTTQAGDQPVINPTSTPSETPTATPTSVPSQWTFEKVELNKEYIAPQNSEVKLTFTKLPSPAGSIKIEEITLTEDQIKQTGSLSDKAYDITSDMSNGTFQYNLR